MICNKAANVYQMFENTQYRQRTCAMLEDSSPQYGPARVKATTCGVGSHPYPVTVANFHELKGTV